MGEREKLDLSGVGESKLEKRHFILSKGKKMKKLFLLIPIIFLNFGCMSAKEHQQELHSSAEREMTLGVVQKEIRVGMSQADVAESLGSPNIVSKDSEGNESWIYDKITTEVSYSQDAGGIIFYGKRAGAVAQEQKTLTIVIKFDENSLVKILSYHSSKF
jgi:outer membrane protein assembly factor BamE (lipoprotein component of BamABCDE complex)